MKSLDKLPAGLSREQPAKNLAALATTNSLDALAATVLAQWQHAETFGALSRHGIRPIDRLLFFGPPGNGKTMASQWLAAQIDAPLYRVRCEALVGALLGATPANVSAVMEWLARQPACVVLFDEIETLFPSRETANDAGMLVASTNSVGCSQRSCGRELGAAMGVFWQYLERLDRALLSRIDLKLEFGPPTPAQAEDVLCYWREVLHEYGGEQWGPELLKRREDFESFRQLFQCVQHAVRQHVVSSASRGNPR